MKISQEQSEKWLNEIYTEKEDKILTHYFFIKKRIQDMGKTKKEQNRMILGLFLKIPEHKKAKAYLWRIMYMNKILDKLQN